MNYQDSSIKNGDCSIENDDISAEVLEFTKVYSNPRKIVKEDIIEQVSLIEDSSIEKTRFFDDSSIEKSRFLKEIDRNQDSSIGRGHY